MDPNARPKSIDQDAYCSAPPFSSPPRLSREEEARRKREPLSLWRSEPRASEVDCAEFIMDDVKPDVKPDVATCSPNAQSRLSTSSSAQESQESPPDNKVRWGPHVVSPPPPPARPTASPPARDSTFIRMPRAPRESARQFDVAVNSIWRTRRRKIMAAVILEDSSSSSSDSDTCDLSDLSELTIESWDEEDDFYDDCWDMKQQPVPDSVETSSHSRDTTRSIGLLRQMSTPRLSSNQDSGASQSADREHIQWAGGTGDHPQRRP